MKQRNYGMSSLIGLVVLVVFAVVAPALGDWEPFPFEDDYVGYSETYTAGDGTYGRTASFSSNYSFPLANDMGMQVVVSEGRLTAWVAWMKWVELSCGADGLANSLQEATACAKKTFAKIEMAFRGTNCTRRTTRRHCKGNDCIKRYGHRAELCQSTARRWRQ